MSHARCVRLGRSVKCTRIRFAAGFCWRSLCAPPDPSRNGGPTSKEDGREEREERGDEKGGEGNPPKVEVCRINTRQLINDR